MVFWHLLVAFVGLLMSLMIIILKWSSIGTSDGKSQVPGQLLQFPDFNIFTDHSLTLGIFLDPRLDDRSIANRVVPQRSVEKAREQDYGRREALSANIASLHCHLLARQGISLRSPPIHVLQHQHPCQNRSVHPRSTALLARPSTRLLFWNRSPHRGRDLHRRLSAARWRNLHRGQPKAFAVH